MKKIGITTTVPSEVLLAAGYQPVDLNNLFVTDSAPENLIAEAERRGFPKNLCTWIKGIYGVCKKYDIDTIIGVVEGDCSNTASLIQILENEGIQTIPFGFPHQKTQARMSAAIDELCSSLGISKKNAELKRMELISLREKVKLVDHLTYEENKVTGFENHLYHVSMSDFFGDYFKCEKILDDFLEKAQARQAHVHQTRLAYIGVPPFPGDLYDFLESLDAKVVYNEVQREFAFPRASTYQTLEEQYLDFTYPYQVSHRLDRIQDELKKRNIQGIIHYTQAFCHKAIEDILFREAIKLPILTLECDKEKKLDARTKLRLEAFIQMLQDQN